MKTLILLAALCGTLQAQTIATNVVLKIEWQFDATRAALKKDEEGIAFAREFARTNTNPSMIANASWSGIIWEPKKGDRELGYADDGTVRWRLVPESNPQTNFTDFLDAVTICTNVCYSTNEIKQLCSSGSVCAVMGHQWQPWREPPSNFALGILRNGPEPERRVCGLCGLKQAKEVKEEWK